MKSKKGAIWLYDLSKMEVKELINNEYYRTVPEIYEDKVVWTDSRPVEGQYGYKTFMYNLSTKEEKLLNNAECTAVYPRIHSDRVTWIDHRQGSFLYDLNTEKQEYISKGLVNHIYGNSVAIENWREWKILRYNILSKEEIEIYKSDKQVCRTVTNDKVIAWVDYRDDPTHNTNDIYMYNFETKETIKVTKAYLLDNMRTQIDRDRLVWMSFWGGIFLYDILTGIELYLTPGLFSCEYADVYKDKVVFKTYDLDARLMNLHFAEVAIYPEITSAVPTEVHIGDTVTIEGTNFGYDQNEGYKVLFHENMEAEVIEWGNTKIRCKVPDGASTGGLKVVTKGGTSNSINMKILASTEPIPGDINGDGIVNLLDLIIVLLALGSSEGDPNWNENADLVKDGTINVLDLGVVLRNFGRRR